MKKSFGLLFSFAFLYFFAQPADTQQLIISVPNADVTHKNEFILTTESQIKTHPDAGSENFAFLTYGIGHDTEIALSAYNLKVPGRNRNIAIAPGFKTSKQILKEKFHAREIKVTVGQMVPISLQGEGVGSWTYGHVSAKIPKLNTHVTAGLNAGTKQIFGRNQVSAMLGVEQPLTKKLMFVADWVSGTHDFAALAAGFQYNFTPRTALVLAYKIPNNRRSGSQAIILEFVKHF